jgi:hypothetical protein
LFLPIYSRILKDIATSKSSALAVLGRNVGENSITLKDILLARQRFDKLLRTIQSNIVKFSTQNPKAGLFSQDTPLKLFDALGREFSVPFYLTGSFHVSGSSVPATFL